MFEATLLNIATLGVGRDPPSAFSKDEREKKKGNPDKRKFKHGGKLSGKGGKTQRRAG